MRGTTTVFALLTAMAGFSALGCLSGAPVGQAESPFAGSWAVNLSNSERAPSYLTPGSVLRFSVDATTTRLVHRYPGQEEVTQTFRIDGDERFVESEERVSESDRVMSARWSGSHIFETVVTGPEGDVLWLATYELSPGDQTLVLTTRPNRPNADDESVIVFDRQ